MADPTENDACPDCGTTTCGLADLYDVADPAENDAGQCSACGQVGGPYPNGDRPKSANPLRSGCPRCGWCY